MVRTGIRGVLPAAVVSIAGLVGARLVAACTGTDPAAVAPGAGDATTGADAATVLDAASRLCDVAEPFSAPIALDALNTDGTASSLRLTEDERVGYFSRRQADAGATGDVRDIFVTRRASPTDPFLVAASVPALTSSLSDDAPSLTADGLTVYFASTRAGGRGSSDVWFATRARTTDDFGTPALVDGVNTATSDASPFVRADGTVLYFSRLDTGFTHGLWRTTRTGNGAFGTPTLLTELGDTNPQYAVVTPDDLVLYYAATAVDAGSPNLDVWVATRSSLAEPFGAAHPLAELSTPDDDVPSFLSADRCTLYLTRRVLVAGTEKSRALLAATRTPR